VFGIDGCLVIGAEEVHMDLDNCWNSQDCIELQDLLVFLTSGSRGWAQYYSSNGSLFLRIQNVKDGKLILDEIQYVNVPDSAEAERTRVQAGDLLISITADLGRTAVIPENLGTAYINQHLVLVRLDQTRAYPDYISRFLASERGQTQFQKLDRGGVKSGLNFNDIRQIRIPLPPIATQKKIAAILDQAEALRSLRRQSIEQLDALARSLFLEMFGDPVTNPKEWKSRQLSECVDKIQIGPFGTQLHQEEYVDNGIPAINPTHIKNGKIIPDASFSVSIEKYQELTQYHLQSNDVILGRRGEMGRCAVITPVENGWLCGTGSLFIRPGSELLNSDYLFSLLSDQSMKEHLERSSQGVTMANLNKTIVGQIPISLPPLALQQEFADRITAIEALKAQHRESLAKMDTLFSSLQHRAFRGEL
jgi:type I restriction enzyme, S subunit